MLCVTAMQARGINPAQLNLALQQNRPQLLDQKSPQPTTMMMPPGSATQQVNNPQLSSLSPSSLPSGPRFPPSVQVSDGG